VLLPDVGFLVLRSINVPASPFYSEDKNGI
jgi:hypothetical protein